MRGASGGAGEFGHIVVDRTGSYASAAIAAAWRHLSRTHGSCAAPRWGLDVGSAEALTALAEQGNELARGVFAQAGETFGRSVANLVNLFNPSLVVISGEGVRAGDLLFEPMRAAMQRHLFAQLAEDLEICVEPLTDETWARGAAGLVLGRIFSVPMLN